MFGPQYDMELLQKWQEDGSEEYQLEERDALALRYFHTRLLFSQVNPGREIHGCSFSQRGRMVLLVVKSTLEDMPQVAFVTEDTTTRCIRVFCRMWLEGRVKWYPDQFG